MDSCGLNNGKLKLYIEKVDTLPKFKIKGKMAKKKQRKKVYKPPAPKLETQFGNYL